MKPNEFVAVWNDARNNGMGGFDYFPAADIQTERQDILNNFIAGMHAKDKS